jgi:phosphoribosylanthranilate isomerase
VWVKICGVTRVADALVALEAGADAIGINLVQSSRRRVELEVARAIVEVVRGRALSVGVIADLALDDAQQLRGSLGLDLLQLHGNEPVARVLALLPAAYKAVAIADAADIARAKSYPGDWLMLDSKVAGQLGGTGTVFDWSLARELSRERSVILAGGLNPDNVAEAVAMLNPFGVDVASGVEVAGEPRRKDAAKVRHFIAQARSRE